MHILFVASINNNYRVAFYGVSVVPFVGVCHIVVRPSADGGFAAGQGFLYGVDGEKCLAYVSLHIIIRVCVAVLDRHISVERPYFGSGTFGIEILKLHPFSRR